MQKLQELFIKYYTWRLANLAFKARRIANIARTAPNPVKSIQTHSRTFQKAIRAYKKLRRLLIVNSTVLAYNDDIHSLFPNVPMIPKNGFEYQHGIIFTGDGVKKEKKTQVSGFNRKRL